LPQACSALASSPRCPGEGQTGTRLEGWRPAILTPPRSLPVLALLPASPARTRNTSLILWVFVCRQHSVTHQHHTIRLRQGHSIHTSHTRYIRLMHTSACDRYRRTRDTRASATPQRRTHCISHHPCCRHVAGMLQACCRHVAGMLQAYTLHNTCRIMNPETHMSHDT